jgi:hypothetical protein
MDNNRRRGDRYRVLFLMRMTAGADGEWLVLSRNMSQTGALVAASSKLAVGDTVTLSFQGMPVDEVERTVKGTIVRVEPNAEDASTYWPHRVAVEFEDPDPELERLLKDASEVLVDRYGD